MSGSHPFNSRPFLSKTCGNYEFIAFWSKKVNKFVNRMDDTNAKAHATHHDLLVKFVNKEYLGGTGKMNHKKRLKGSKHDDLTTSSDVIEFKFCSNTLESLPAVLKNREMIFTRNDYLYFSYFRERGQKDKTKIIKTHNCIFYLILILFPRKIEKLDLKELVKDVRKEEIKFTKEVAEKSGVDLEVEELYAVGNMIKVRKLERETEEKDRIIKEKDKIIEENKKAIEENKETIEENKETIEEKDKEIKQLKSQLKTNKKLK